MSAFQRHETSFVAALINAVMKPDDPDPEKTIDRDALNGTDPYRYPDPRADVDLDEEPPPEPDYMSYSLAQLDQGLWALAGHLNAATYRQLAMVIELDRREPWVEIGCLSCAHYLNWRCGIALGAAREKVRTARALTGLPRIARLFRLGRISYSKVRALTRAATADNEEEFLEVALHATGDRRSRGSVSTLMDWNRSEGVPYVNQATSRDNRSPFGVSPCPTSSHSFVDPRCA